VENFLPGRRAYSSVLECHLNKDIYHVNHTNNEKMANLFKYFLILKVYKNEIPLDAFYGIRGMYCRGNLTKAMVFESMNL
jgi:hypothetical protein